MAGRTGFSASVSRWDDDLQNGVGDDANVHHQRPVPEVEMVVAHAMTNLERGVGFSATTANLGEAGDARFGKVAHGIVVNDLGKAEVVIDEMRTRSDDAHVTEEDVQKLGKLVDAGATQEGGSGINARVALGRLRARIIVQVHGPELVDFEHFAVSAGAFLSVEKRTTREQELQSFHSDAHRGQDREHDSGGEGEIESALEEAIDGILEWLLPVGEKEVRSGAVRVEFS